VGEREGSACFALEGALEVGNHFLEYGFSLLSLLVDVGGDVIIHRRWAVAVCLDACKVCIDTPFGCL
jgi:hypothetical protein